MKIFITTKTRSKKVFVEPQDQTNYIVAVKEAPVEGRANDAVIAALAEYFNIHKNQINITTGHTGKRKVVEIDLELDKTEEVI